MYILEAVALMTACPCSTSSSDERERQATANSQRQLLAELSRILLTQLDAILKHPLLERYAEDMAGAVAHKLACLASLARPFSYKSQAHEHARISLDNVVAALEASLNILGRFAAVRNKAVVLMHRLVTCLGIRALSVGEICLSTLLRSGNTDIDAALQLFNQFMTEFREQSTQLVDLALRSVLESLRLSYVCADSSGSNTGSRPEIVAAMQAESNAPHVVVEREAVLKQYFLVIQHIADCNCIAALCSEKNAGEFTQILSVLGGGLGGSAGAGAGSSEVGIAVRRSAVGALTCLLRAIFDNRLDTVVFDGACIERQIAGHRHLLAKMLREQAIPSVMISLGESSLDMRDAATNALLGDIATLLWVYLEVFGQEEVIQFMESLLRALNWPSETGRIILSLLSDVGPIVRLNQTIALTSSQINSFRDKFRKLIRNLRSSNSLQNIEV